jgi:hydroxymethylglutaryl-CoA lyase
MSQAVKIIECPRDAWQGLPAPIPPQAKATYLRALVDAGFSHIDAVSFVSPSAVPQMADSEQVLELLAPPPDIEIIAIVVNEKGADRAIRTCAVRTLGFPYSVSAEFLRRNQHQTPQEALNELCAIHQRASAAGLNTVAYLSMAFGNPYGDPWNAAEVITACRALFEAGIGQLSLADTVGLAADGKIADTFAAVLQAIPGIEVGIHLHARRDQAAARIRAAFHAGCRRFDAAVGGLGGCPFAQDALVGNIPTEILLETLSACGAMLPRLAPLDSLIRASAEIAHQPQ